MKNEHNKSHDKRISDILTSIKIQLHEIIFIFNVCYKWIFSLNITFLFLIEVFFFLIDFIEFYENGIAL